MDQNKFIGCIIGKVEENSKGLMKSYIAMIAVKKDYRGKGIGKQLVNLFLNHIRDKKAVQVYLETEVTNTGAIKLYESNY